ncbi:MAG: ornithine cyclodeaminase family protein [Chloroflexi bacterium]|nr:MAG: ornithine cyclodeaminase family protein [Chloroflexota bacterium]TME46729.1 MAG: ornithine cyclodeaminase family protein [Chloroflexota bacterium]
MNVLVLSAEDVARLLPMPDCIGVMRDALAALARGQALVPLRMVMRMPDASGFLGLMPGYIAPDGQVAGALGMKAVSVFPGNASRGIDTHQGAVLLFEADTGRLAALMDGATITAIRTAAVSGVATDMLARDDAAELAILGAGVQARTHLEAIAVVRRLRRARVWSRNPEHARALVDEQRSKFQFPLEATSTAEAAVREADIIATVTASPEPVLQHAWLEPGAHINAVGSSIPGTRELDTATVAAARLFVDRRESALSEAGDVLIPIREGAIKPDHIVAELGEVIIGKDRGRRSRAELTLFKSLGLSVEDVASAAFIAKRAREAGVGQTVAM